MTERKEIKELSEWLTNLVKADEASKSPDLPARAFDFSRVSVYTIGGGNDNYLSLLTDDKKNRSMCLDFIKYFSARDWASDNSPWPQSISVKLFLKWQQNIPEIKEHWNTLQDLIDEVKRH